jgi:hypothetical protein
VYCPIDNLLAFVYVLREFALVGNFDEDLITFTIVSEQEREDQKTIPTSKDIWISRTSHLSIARPRRIAIILWR